MRYKIFADLMVVLHFAWILFMLWGFLLTLYSVVRLHVLRSSTPFCTRFLDRWIFRTVHAGGIVFVALLAAMGKYCPLTVWEYQLRLRYDPTLSYPGSFIASWIKKVIYPSVPVPVILIPTIFIAFFTLLAYLFHPPGRIRQFLKMNKI